MDEVRPPNAPLVWEGPCGVLCAICAEEVEEVTGAYALVDWQTSNLECTQCHQRFEIELEPV